MQSQQVMNMQTRPSLVFQLSFRGRIWGQLLSTRAQESTQVDVVHVVLTEGDDRRHGQGCGGRVCRNSSAGCASADPSCPLALSEGRCGSLLSTRCRIAALLDADMVGWQKERAQASV
jgi:hypothetical protein